MRPCTIVGNVGGTPELRYTPNGVAVVNFSLALYGGKSEDGAEQTTWVRVTCWKGLADIVMRKVAKGDKIQVEGYLNPVELYQTKEKTTAGSLSLTAWSVKALEYTPVELDATTREALALAHEALGVESPKKGKTK